MPTISPMFKPRLDPFTVPGRRRTAADGAVVTRPAAARLHGVVVGRVSTWYGGARVRTATIPPLVGAGKGRTTANVERRFDQRLWRVDGDSDVDDNVQYCPWSSSTSCSREFTTIFSKRAVIVRISSPFDLDRCGAGTASPDDLDSTQSVSSSSLFHDGTHFTLPASPSPEATGAMTSPLSGSSKAWSLLLLPVPDTGRFLQQFAYGQNVVRSS